MRSRRHLRRCVHLRGSIAAWMLLVGCESTREPQARYEQDELAPLIFEGDDGVSAIGAPAVPSLQPPYRPPYVILPSPEDSAYANDAPVHARRFVYRVTTAVPAGLGGGEAIRVTPAAELFVDVSHDRLRARFEGQGWPIPPGTEVRMRRDRPGVYLFDGAGGRLLGPGEMAQWFEGGPITRRGPPLRVFAMYGFQARTALPDDVEEPGEMVCALLAEWANDDLEAVMRRCRRGAPHLWRLGFWRAEQTAGIPMSLARRDLRADEIDPPRQATWSDGGAMLEAEAFARIPPFRGPRGEGNVSLRLHNRSPTRVVVSISGVPFGWVDADAQHTFEGFTPGSYDFGSLRPLGAVVGRARRLDLPAQLEICDGRCREP